jgi:AAA+ superfamily predicted ATPase
MRWYDLENPKEERQIAQEALLKDPHNAKNYYQLAAACTDMLDFKEALMHCKKAIKIEPDNIIYHALLSFIFAKTGRYSQAIEALSKIIELGGDDSDYHVDLAIGALAGVNNKMVFKKAAGLKERQAETLKKWLIRPDNLDKSTLCKKPQLSNAREKVKKPDTANVMRYTGSKRIENDKNYIETYFNICELMHKKRNIIDIQKRTDEKQKQETSDKNKISPECEIAHIDKMIKTKEHRFWEEVNKSLKDGKCFVIEQLAAHYSLDDFEKRVFIFFIYIELYQEYKNILLESEILALFDYEGSAIQRMQRIKYFGDESPLIRHQILDKGGRRPYGKNDQEYALSIETLRIVSNMLNGIKLEDGISIKKRGKSYEKIGYVKTPKYKLDDVKLKDDIKDKIRVFLLNFNKNTLKELGVYEAISNSKGLVFLFYGPPGTGKTMLSEAIASYLNKEMLIVESPKITSMWHGETDKNISLMFKSAQEHNMLLCIDEADTLLFSRKFALQDHDIRFVNVMLQELERFEGVAVLTTNMDILLDPALERRVSLKVKFEEPNEHIRASIWQSHIPDKVKVSDDVDFKELGRKYAYSGGYIKTAVLNALRKMQLDKRYTLTMEDLVFGGDTESQGIFNQQKRQAILGFAART